VDNVAYIGLSRQAGLMRELDIIANNLANANTTGFRREGAVFSEHVKALQGASQRIVQPSRSLSIGHLGAHATDFSQGGMKATGAPLDIAIEGEGFFVIDTPAGQSLTRAGAFLTNSEGQLITPDGYGVLDDAGGQINFPADAGTILISRDGSITVDGDQVARLGVVDADPLQLERLGDNLWRSPAGTQQLEDFAVRQGFLETSNVSPVTEIARMIEVQRHYDAGQTLLELDNERIKNVVTTLRQLA